MTTELKYLVNIALILKMMLDKMLLLVYTRDSKIIVDF